MPRVLVLGSINTDMIVPVPELPAPGQTVLGGDLLVAPGGKGSNQAVAARRAGAEVALVAAVGDDDRGARSIEQHRDEGIDVSAIAIKRGVPTGAALIQVDSRGENLIAVSPGANARLAPQDVDALPDALFQAADILLAVLEVPLETVVAALRRARRVNPGARTVVNPAPTSAEFRARLPELVPLIDLLTPNRVEARGLLPDAPDDPARLVEALEALGLRAVLMTLGASGALLRTGGASTMIPPLPAVAVDTVGAGDAFNGALAARWAEGAALDEAARFAAVAAGLAVSAPGAQTAIPPRSRVLEHLNSLNRSST